MTALRTTPPGPAQTKHYYHLVMIAALFAMLTAMVSAKTVDFFGVPISVNAYFFPFVYIVSDLLTEVYGYALARRALWYVMIARALLTLIAIAVVLIPPSATMRNHEAFVQVFAQTPIFVVVGIIAIFVGDIANNWVITKMKKSAGNAGMAKRFVVSTVVGEGLNTAIYYFFALVLTGIIPFSAALAAIATGTLVKTAVEVIFLPLTIYLAKKLKRVEGFDAVDRNTSLNPFIF